MIFNIFHFSIGHLYDFHKKCCTFAAKYLMMMTMEQLRLTSILLSLCILFSCGGKEEGTQTLISAKDYLEAGEKELDRDSVVQGETMLRKAISVAEEQKDWHTAYVACQRLAEPLSWSNTEEALKLSKKALKIYEAHPDDERNHIILLDFVGTYAAQWAYNEESAYTEAIDYTRRAYQLAVKKQQSDLVCQTLTSLANIYWAMEDYPQALHYAREAAPLSTPELLQGTLQVLARCYLECDSLEQAEATYRRMNQDEDIQTAYIVQSNLAKIAVRRYDVDEAEEAIDSAFEKAEDFYFKALEQKDAYYQATLQQEKENEHLTYTSALHQRTFVGVVLVLAALLIALLLTWHYRMQFLRQQHSHEVLMHEQEKRMLQQEAASQQEQLRQAKEVVTFLQNFILQRSEIIQKLNQNTDSHISISSKEWADVERTLNAIDGNRFAHLRKAFLNLKEEDIQLCILTRLQLSNRSIGNIYGLTISAVQHRKLKLKKDVFGESNPEVTLEQVINQLQ